MNDSRLTNGMDEIIIEINSEELNNSQENSDIDIIENNDPLSSEVKEGDLIMENKIKNRIMPNNKSNSTGNLSEKIKNKGNISLDDVWGSKKEILCGYLFKQGTLNWKTRWFVFSENNHRLWYYEKKGDKDPINFISLDAKTFITPELHSRVPDKKYAGFSFKITTSYTYKEYVLCCKDKKEYGKWIRGLREAVSQIVDDNEEDIKYIDKVFESFNTAKNDTNFNFPVTDILIHSAKISKIGNYFVACYSENHKFKSWAINESSNPTFNCDGTL